MPTSIKSVEYFRAIVQDQPGEAYQLLSNLKNQGVNLLAFNVAPLGEENCELIVFPEEPEHLGRVAADAKLQLVGPQKAFVVQGDDELGVLAEIHRKLFERNVNVDASNGVSDGRGGYGYVIYVRASDYDQAAEVLGAIHR